MFFSDAEVSLAPGQDELPKDWRDAEAVVWSRWPVDKQLIESMPRLRFMQRLGRFRAQGDASAAFERGIPVSVLPHGTSGRVAEHTFALLIALFRGLLASHNAVVEGRNPANLAPVFQVGGTPGLNWARLPGLQSLHFKTIGIVGFGEIGACVARLLAPFDTRTLYNKRTPLTAEQERFYHVEYASFEDLLRSSDAVVDFLPTNDATRGMLGEGEFAMMKPTAYFVNTGRAATTDEAALVKALEEKRIAGAGIDVFAYEPIPRDHPVLNLSNVLLTPHTAGGGGTPERVLGGLSGWTDTFERIKENLRRVEAREPVLSPMGGDDPLPG
jgi:phosphoglycerate dehydrogenase-like enzyme